MISVYITSPFGEPEILRHIRQQVKLVKTLEKEGFKVRAPLVQSSVIEQRDYPDKYKAWIDECDCVFKPGGETDSIMREVAHARLSSKPVFTFLGLLIQWAENERKHREGGGE